MRKLKKQNTSMIGRKAPVVGIDDEGSWIKKHWLSVTLLLLVVLTIIVRTIFSYGLSAGSNFALSGTGAAEHKHTIESILMGTFGLSDPSLNYPYGGTLIQPPLVDMILAGFAWIVTLFGVSISSASAGVLAFSGPIAAAITVVLVYILGKEMFDKTVGIFAALLFATLPLLVVSSVFSNGSGMSVVLMFFVIAMILVVRAMKTIETSERGIKVAFTKNVLKYTIPAGLMFAAIALSWNGFRMIILLLGVMLVAQVILLHLRNRNFHASFGVYATMILVAILVPLPYYVVSGMFTSVFTGALLLAAISIATVLPLYIFRKKPKSHAFLIAIVMSVVRLAVLYLLSPTLFNDLVVGNQIYETSLIASLLGPQSISVSYMATFYGWATVWMPFVIITYMLYRFSQKNHSETKLMVALWISGMFILSWLSRDNAVMAGAMYAIAAAAVLVTLYRYIEMTSYFQSIRGGGWKASLKKFLKPEPFISLIAILFLVIAPNAMLLADASTSSNRDNQVSAGYLGGIGYTVDTDEYNSTAMMWDHYSGMDNMEGAVVTWFEDSSTAVDRGKFDKSVTSNSGQGASAASNIMLAEGSAGAFAAMSLRMIMGEGVEKYQNNINIDAAVLAGVADIIKDPTGSKDKVLKNPDIYPGVSADISDENAIYLVAIKYITDELTETGIYDFYNGISKESEGGIAYIALNAGMIPFYYGYGSQFSSIAYLNDYELDSRNAVNKYFSYGNNGLVNYKDAIFESFIWKSLFGINKDPSITSNLINDLLISDGTVKAQPGLGLTGFDVDYWYVKYNPDNDANPFEDGWVFMDGYEAITKQKSDGGLINYFSSLVMMKVTDSDAIVSQEGIITYDIAEPLQGAKVAVFEKDDNGMFVQRSTSFTNEAGEYSVKIPVGLDCEIRVYTATNKTVGGTYVGVITHPDVDYLIPLSTVSGTVEGYADGVKLTAVGTYSGVKADTTTLINGDYEFPGLPSDEYIIVASLGTHTIGTQTVTIYPGANSGVDFGLSKLIVTVKDVYGAPVPTTETVVIESKLTGDAYEQITADGIATFAVMPMVDKVTNSGEYIVYVKDSISTSASIKVSGTAITKTDITIYGTEHIIGLTGDITVMAPGYSSSGTNGNVDLPGIGDSTFTLLYGDDKVQTFKDGLPLGAELDAVKFTATLKSDSDKPIAGTVTFFGTDGSTLTYLANADGEVNAMLPEGNYVAYAVGNDGSCSITEVNVLADGNKDLTTEDGRKLTVTMAFSSGVDGQKGLAFRQVQVDVEVETGVTKTIFGTTDSKGKAIMTIPDNKVAKVSIAGESTGEVTWAAVVDKEVTLGATDVSMSPLSTVVAKPTITGTGTSNTWLLKSPTSTPIELSVPKGVTPGAYICVEDNAGVYTYSKVNVYAGQNIMFTVPDTVVTNLSLVNVETPEDATVTVEADPDNKDAVYYKIDLLTSDNYLLESSNVYQFKAVKGEQISYIRYDGTVLDHTDFELKDKVTLKGYVGVNGDGTAWVTIGTIDLFTEVKNGVYEVDVPAVDGTAIINVKVKATPSGTVGKCDYEGDTDVDITEISKGTVITKNMQVTGDGKLSNVTDKLTVSVDGVSSTGVGKFKFDLEVAPAIDATVTKTYAVKTVGPWQLDKAYTVTVVGSTVETITVNGTFDPTMVGDGNKEMKVSLVDLKGVTKATGEITPGYVIPDTVNTVKMIVAGESGASPDAVTDHEYLYAVTIQNDANYMMYAVLDLGAYTGTYTVTDENGRIMDPNGSFPVAGKADTTLYVKLMKIDGEDIPDITVSASITATDGTPEISGPTSYALESKAIELESSLSIDGNNVYDEGSSPQTAFWVLLLMSVVMIVLVFWLGSKRGVFTRRK